MAYHPSNDRIQELELALSKALDENERFRNQIAETSQFLVKMANTTKDIQEMFQKSSERTTLLEIRLELMTKENHRLKDKLSLYQVATNSNIPTDALDQLGRE